MVLIFFIFKVLYNCCGGFIYKWKRLFKIFNIFVVIWCEVIFFGLKGLKLLVFYDGIIGCIFFVRLYGFEI